jgi:hypothetical protein
MSTINLGEHLFAWVTEEPDGNISLVGAYLPRLGGNLPLIGRSLDAIMTFQDVARLHAKSTGQRVWLREYVMIDNTEDLNPRG